MRSSAAKVNRLYRFLSLTSGVKSAEAKLTKAAWFVRTALKTGGRLLKSLPILRLCQWTTTDFVFVECVSGSVWR